MAFADIYHIEQQLQSIDPHILRIDFDERRALHRIVAWDDLYKEDYIAFTVKLGELDARVVEQVRMYDPRKFNVSDYLEGAQKARERAEDQKINDMSTDMAENMLSSFARKPSRTIE